MAWPPSRAHFLAPHRKMAGGMRAIGGHVSNSSSLGRCVEQAPRQRRRQAVLVVLSARQDIALDTPMGVEAQETQSAILVRASRLTQDETAAWPETRACIGRVGESR